MSDHPIPGHRDKSGTSARAGILLCLLARRHRVARPGMGEVAQAAAAVAHTVPVRRTG